MAYMDDVMAPKQRVKKRSRKKKGALTASKAKKMLHDNSAQGHALTKKQRGYFGAVASGN